MDEVREPTFLILCALAAGPRHGYAIRRDVEKNSSGEIVLRTGTLYAALDRLATSGLVARCATEQVEGRTRHTYQLTDAGTDLLRAASQRRQATAKLALTRLRVLPS